MDTATLSDVFNAPGPFATVLVDVSHDNENATHEHELRVRDAVDALKEQGADDQVVERVRERLVEVPDRPSPVGRIVVANAEGVLLDQVAGFRVDPPVATYGPLPDLARWIQHRDAVTMFVLALVDHEGGDVAVYDSDVPDPADESSEGGETLHVNKVPVGGWSALRFNHVTENVWIRNAKDVAAKVKEHVEQGIDLVLYSGDPHSMSILADELEGVDATVVQLETGTRNEDGGDEARQQAIREALLQQAVEQRLRLSHELKDRLGQDRAVATGVRDVADAFVRGQVETLLLDPSATAELTLDPGQHPGLALGPGRESGPVRADQALVAAAAVTGAAVSVVPSTSLGGAAAAALLRWDQ